MPQVIPVVLGAVVYRGAELFGHKEAADALVRLGREPFSKQGE